MMKLSMKLDDLVNQPYISDPENQTRKSYESENPAHSNPALSCAGQSGQPGPGCRPQEDVSKCRDNPEKVITVWREGNEPKRS